MDKKFVFLSFGIVVLAIFNVFDIPLFTIEITRILLLTGVILLYVTVVVANEYINLLRRTIQNASD